MNYNQPQIENWDDKDPRRQALSWTLEDVRRRHNQYMPKFQPPITEVASLIGHPCHPYLDRVSGLTLDIGCGNGSILLSLMRDKWIEYGIGIDISDEMIKNAIQSAGNLNIENCQFIQSAVEEYQPDALFDSIIAYDVLEHVLSVTRVLRWVSHQLMSGGVFVGTTPYSRCLDDVESRLHLHYFNNDELFALFGNYFHNVSVLTKTIAPNENRLYFLCENKK